MQVATGLRPKEGYLPVMKLFGATLFLLSISAAPAALADPCKAIPDKGPMPAHLKPASTFSGPVSYVGDGDSLCVAIGRSPADWVEVRIADFYAPELHEPGGRDAKAALERIANGREVECRARRSPGHSRDQNVEKPLAETKRVERALRVLVLHARPSRHSRRTGAPVLICGRARTRKRQHLG
jgi:micrococcal nuclease